MRKLFTLIVCTLLTILVLDEEVFDNNLYNLYKNYYEKNSYSIVTNLKALKTSKYFNNDYSTFVHNTSNFYPKNIQELLDVHYTILNNGWENFSYYCDESYTSCLDDISKLSEDGKIFSDINQLVHPYNSFKLIKSSYNSNYRIDMNITKKYNDEEIDKIDEKINSIINELGINDYNNVEDKIKIFHNYIANTNKYDTDKEKKISNYNSDSAIGTLFEGYSICSGYTDTMAIFLSKLGLDNIRVASDKHTWNAVKINGKWKHIDLTWDDPVTSTGEDIITYDYFLISTSELNKKNNEEHYFNTTVYDFIN